MFAPRSTSLGTMPGRPHDRVTFATTNRNDENAIVSTAKNITGTPQSTTSKHRSKIPQPSQQRRRAFGDISNKKKPLGDSRRFGSASKPGAASPSTNKLWIQPDSVTPRRLPLQPRQQANSNRKPSPSSSSSSLVKPNKSSTKSVARLPPRSVVSSTISSSIPRPTSSSLSTARKPKSRVVEFTLPQPSESSLSASKLEAKSIASTNQNSTMKLTSIVKPNSDNQLEPVDDVELPAGRLWSEQVALDDLDDSSFQEAYKDGMEQLTTMWDDWRYIMVDQLDEKRRKQEEADAQADAAYEEEMFEKYKRILDEDGTTTTSFVSVVFYAMYSNI